jgi:hypothetical protein
MPQQHPPQEYATFLLLMFVFFFLSSDNTPPPGFLISPREHAASQVARLRHNLDVINTTRWQDFSPLTAGTPRGEPSRYLNLTGFRADDGYAWDRVDAFWQRCEEARGRAADATWRGARVYENTTGIVTGRWVRWEAQEERSRTFNLSEIAPGVDWSVMGDGGWGRNITGAEGKLRLSVDENEDGDQEGVDAERVREVTATMTVQDETSSGDGWDVKVHGVHWPKQGEMLLTTTSDKFAGLFGLPHLTTSVDHFKASRALLNRTLEKTVQRMERTFWADVSNPWPSSPETQRDAAMPSPHCEFVVYVQVQPLDLGFPLNKNYADPASFMHEIEQELRFPNGAPISEVPPLRMSTVIFSPDCGFVLESKGPPEYPSVSGDHLVGRKQEVYLHKVKTWLLIFAAVMFGQVLLLKMQSKEASTPSTIGRVSINTVAMMLMADGLLFSSLSLVSATSTNIFPAALLTAFAALMSMALGVRFILAIYNIQEPERRERQRIQRAQEANRRATPVAVAADMPIIIPSDQDIQAEIDEVSNAAAAVPRPLLPTATQAPPQPRTSNFVTLYVRFVVCLTLILFISLASLSWPVPVRSAYINILSGLYLSFWVPQIRRNIVRNCRKALLWRFVIGQSVFRLLPFSYFYLRKDNILFSEPDWTAFSVLVAWVWIQILVLIGQGVLGPRYGIPKGWTEEAWDYHPVLSEDNVESGGMPIGLVQIPGSPTSARTSTEEGRKKTDGGVRTVDCAICMQILEVPVVPSGVDPAGAAAGGVAGILTRRLYMVTPCRHVFHSACLEGWMRFRLQCPICRENLPPL